MFCDATCVVQRSHGFVFRRYSMSYGLLPSCKIREDIVLGRMYCQLVKQDDPAFPNIKVAPSRKAGTSDVPRGHGVHPGRPPMFGPVVTFSRTGPSRRGPTGRSPGVAEPACRLPGQRGSPTSRLGPPRAQKPHRSPWPASRHQGRHRVGFGASRHPAAGPPAA